MVFIKMLQTKMAINASRAMRNDFIWPKFLFQSNTIQPCLSNYTQSHPTLNNRTLLQTKREISRAYPSSQKIFRVRHLFFYLPWTDAKMIRMIGRTGPPIICRARLTGLLYYAHGTDQIQVSLKNCFECLYIH